MTFDKKGNLIIVSDNGAFLKSQVAYTENNLVNLFNSTLGIIKDNCKILDSNMQDIEEIAYYKDGVVISHEGANKLSFYDQADFANGIALDIKVPDSIKNLPRNRGIEAMSISSEGKILTIDESSYVNYGDLHRLYYWDAFVDFTELNNLNSLNYQSSEGFDVSGAAFLPNGNLLVLERKFTKGIISEDYEIKLKIISKLLLDSKQGSIINGLELLSIGNCKENKNSIADNFESVAIQFFDAQHLGIFLLTDDNRATFQRTILLQFNTTQEILENFAEKNYKINMYELSNDLNVEYYL